MSRFLADAVDLLVVLSLTGLVYFGIAGLRFLVTPRRFEWPALGALPLGALAWGLLIAYLTVAWSGTGRSVGKQLMGLRVQRLDGGRLAMALSFARAVLCAAFPIGLFWSLVSRENASIQDLLARTKVVYDWRPRVPAT